METNNMNPGLQEEWVHPCYRLDTWKQVYSHKIRPTNGPSMCPKCNLTTTIIPPNHHPQPGRPNKKKKKRSVYKGVLLDSGEVVAVKRCSHSGGQGMDEFLSELSIIGTLRHQNLVRLQGWCHEKGEILLVYDLMPNGSLDKALFESKLVLPWVHATVAAATMGYLLTGRASEKTDAFSFGAVVLEVATGQRPIEKEGTGFVKMRENSNLVEWVWSLHKEERLLDAAGPRLCGEYDAAELRKILLIGLVCSHPDPTVRPTIRNVVQMLVGEADVPVVSRDFHLSRM